MNANQPDLYCFPRALKCAAPLIGTTDFSRRGCITIEHGLRYGTGYTGYDRQSPLGCLATG